MKKQLIPFLVSIILLSSCSTIKYVSDYDVSKDFNNYSTFLIMPNQKLAPLNNLNERRLLAAINQQMENRGYEQAKKPDLLIKITIKEQRKKQAYATTTYSGYHYGGYYHRYGWGHGSGVTQIHYDRYTEGTLIISLIDRERKELIWESSAMSVMNSTSRPGEKEINYIVNKMFSRFPKEK
jgi:hypothetical protein